MMYCVKTFWFVKGDKDFKMKTAAAEWVFLLTLSCSVGNAPTPTRVVYALTTPYTRPT